MGFNNKEISTGNTCTNVVQLSWTDIGREYLIGKRKNRKKGLNILYFSLSDGDINYFIENNETKGFIPNVTGIDNQCINGNKLDNVSILLNLNKIGLILIKNYKVSIPLSPLNFFNCPIESLTYDLFINGDSIFKVKPLYQQIILFGSQIPLFQVEQFKVSLKNDFIKNEYLDVVDIDLTIEPIGNNFFIKETSYIINGQPFNVSITDNSSSSCNNIINSSITFTQEIVLNPDIIETVNFSIKNLPDCI